MAAPVVWKKPPLTLEQVPLPPAGGFTHALLDETLKAQMRKAHEEKIERITKEAWTLNKNAEAGGAYAEELLALCARDLLFFIEHFCWVHEPRTGEDNLMVAYPYEIDKIIRPYERLRRVQPPARISQMKAKSRDMGVTWFEIACRAHSFLFLDNWSILMGGVTQGLVDDGGALATHESLLGKLRYLLRHLPKWMQNALLGPRWTKNEYTKKLKQLNPMRPHNVIDGKQVGDLFGRSGRYSEAWVDEFAYSDKVKNAERAIKQTTSRFCGTSTPKGRGNLFEQLMFSMELAVEQIWIWWPEHPFKDLNWYNIQRQDMDEVDVASELDISFDESRGGRVLPEVHIPTHFVKRPNRHPMMLSGEPEGSLWEPSLPVQVVIDFGASHPMAAVWFQWNEKASPPWGVIIDFVQIQGVSVDWIVPLITGKIPEATWRGDVWPHQYTPEELQMVERHSRWGPPADVFGDWQGSTANLVTGAHSAFDELEKYGIVVTPVKILDDYGSISSARQLMRHMKVDERLITQRNGNMAWCPTFSEVVTQWRFKEPREGETQNSLKPVHDKFCHGGDCIKMAAATIDVPTSDMVMSLSASRPMAKKGNLVVRRRYWSA